MPILIQRLWSSDVASIFCCWLILSSKYQSGSNATLKIEIDDPALQSIEFVVVDEAQNKWSVWYSRSLSSFTSLSLCMMPTNLLASSLNRFKNNGENFLIHIRPDHHQGQHSAPAATTERISRKNRDVMQLLSKHASTSTGVNKATEATPGQSPTVLDLFLKSLQENNGGQVLCKKVFKLGEKEILVSSDRYYIP